MIAASRLLPRARALPRALARARKTRVRTKGARRNWTGTVVAVLHTAALAFLIAVIVHIAIVLLVPRYAPVDAWAKLSAVTRPWNFTEIAVPAGAEGSGPAIQTGLDPRFGVVACRFDLAEGPVSIVGAGDVPFWSLAVFDRRGQNIYSLNDRTAISGRLDLVVLNATQRAQLRENPVEGLDSSILVRTDMGEGFVLVRALAPDETWTPAVRAFLRGATCERLVLPTAGPASPAGD